MHWHFEDIPLLIHNLPNAVHDLMRHEDKEIVQKGVSSLQKIAPPPKITIEKSLDPMAARSAQNIGLLLHDYLQQLPEFEVAGSDENELLEHWRKVLLEQPTRLAIAKSSHFHDDSTKAFWHDTIAKHHEKLGLSKEELLGDWDNWQRMEGTQRNLPDLARLSAAKQKQWQDLVIRSRLHKESTMRNNYDTGVRF